MFTIKQLEKLQRLGYPVEQQTGELRQDLTVDEVTAHIEKLIAPHKVTVKDISIIVETHSYTAYCCVPKLNHKTLSATSSESPEEAVTKLADYLNTFI